MVSAAIKIDDLTKVYPNGTSALKGISFDVQEGDFFALLGPNGAGKSTTIGVITTLIPKTSGAVSIFGHTFEADIERIKARIGVVPQEFNFNFYETTENILYDQAGYYGISRRQSRARVEHYLKHLSLWEKRKTVARLLSGGMKRRLMIARALIHEPRLLILDEPTAGVDIEIRRSMWRFLKKLNQEGKTIILTTHYLEEAEHLCRHLAIIDQGRIVRHAAIQTLLRELKQDVFIFNLERSCDTLPASSDFQLKRIDAFTIEAIVDNANTLNQLFSYFTKHRLSVKSMRNQSNRLETLFLELTQRDKTHDLS